MPLPSGCCYGRGFLESIDVAIQERYNPVQCAVNTTTPVPYSSLGGFFAVTAGTVTIVDNLGNTIIPAFTVDISTYYPLPFLFSQNGGTITTSGGASGVLGAY